MGEHAKATRVGGGCLCGRVRYEAEVFLESGYLCHCTMCRKSTGQPAEITVFVKPGTLRFIKGEPKFYRSSEVGQRGFCPHCGSRLVWQALRPEDDWQTNLCVGGLDDPSKARMAFHIHTDTRLPWYRACEGLPAYEEKDGDAVRVSMRRAVGRAE